ncbi:MAG: hypothetical protein ACJZ57_03235, partial [Candidatus Poriferisodalaceae bacterium]
VVDSSGSAEEGDILEDVDRTVSLSDLLTPPDEDEAAATVALLGSTGQTGFVLAPAELTGEVIEEAVATFQGQWIVESVVQR